MPSFAEAFRLQAASDLSTYESLVSTRVPVSHRLHYLQMWLEKLCKAYLWLPGAAVPELRARHQVVGAVLPRLVAEKWRRLKAFEGTPPAMAAVRALCREVDLLHPQVDDAGRRPDNVEYPWEDRGLNYVPAEFKFALAGNLYKTPGPSLLKAAVQLTRDPDLLLG
ncbi:MAG: hypothetical protein R3B13_16565 [Polyangiaceae bacterium]